MPFSEKEHMQINMLCSYTAVKGLPDITVKTFSGETADRRNTGNMEILPQAFRKKSSNTVEPVLRDHCHERTYPEGPPGLGRKSYITV